MKKNAWKLVLCLALAAVMLTCVALAADAPEKDGDVTIDGVKLKVETNVTEAGYYALLQVKVDGKGKDVSELMNTPVGTLPINKDTILYIDQVEVAADSLKATFNGNGEGFQPRTTATSVFILGGGSNGPKVVAAMKVNGITVEGDVKAWGGDATTQVTVALKEDDSITTTVTVDANGEGHYTLENVAVDEGTLVVSSGTKYVAREYEIDMDAPDEMDVEINPLGDADLDGDITIIDVDAAYSHVLDIDKLTGYAEQCAKTQGDEVVTIIDVDAIYSHVLSMGTGPDALW